ncbi:MAG TPA: hypothetical protein VFU69_00500 [Ktedonobacterales bacterium]|nr:hypothetical protein [Ktedonobacterales bacterium]
MLSRFIVIDLESQAEVIALYIRGWTRPRFLAWLSRFGEIARSSHDPDSYLFFSHVGLHTAFRLNEEGDFILILLAGTTMKLVARGLFDVPLA